MELDDIYLTNNVDVPTIDKYKVQAELEVEALGINNDFYFNMLVKNRVYMFLAMDNYENDEAKEKYKAYERSFKYYVGLAKGESPIISKSVKSVKLGRG